MAVKKKYKKLSNAEKKMNKAFRENLRAEGILPPIKPKLNRYKFAKEVIKEFEGFNSYNDLYYIYKAIGWMQPYVEQKTRISPEEIGVLKMLKLAMEIKKFMEEKKKNGDTKYSVQELYDKVIAPIKSL